MAKHTMDVVSGPAAGAKWIFAAMMIAALAVGGCGGEEKHPPADTPLDPANELPFGHVDMPPAGAGVQIEVGIAGWAMDERGVREIRIYVDGHFAKTTTLNTERPDVSAAFPAVARGTNLHGWTTSITFDAPGVHSIVVQAVDTNGATRDIGALTVTSRDQ
jgi:hypothetical protein